MDEDCGWELMVDDHEQHRGFAALGRVMRSCCPGAFPRTVVQEFLPSLYFHKELCWTASVAFFAEFVGSPNIAKEEQKMMLDVYNVMKLFIYNGNPIIIMYGMRGISNAIHTMPKKAKKYKESVLGIFLRSLSNPWDPNVKQEAITGVSKILPYLPSIETSTSIQLAQQAQNCFDDENPFIRQKALEIFGQQSQYFHWRSDSFSELVEKYLAHILIHLQDNNPKVAKTAEATLWKCAPFIRHKPLRNLILNFLHKEDHKVTNSFLMEVSRLLVEDCPGRLNKTLTTRAEAACELIGHLMKQEDNKTD
ncbi:protein maestro-like [Tiliqua scincoides]|uniref:protein maestro-like n=1 Tax=Tiliqua scincoides TaxID=71010 RepID=UPI003462F12E